MAIVLAALADRTGKDETAWLEPVMPVATVSFGVYLWHPVIELFAYSFLWKRVFGVDDPVAFWLFMPLPFLVTIVVALVSARRFELPAGKWIETSLTALVQARGRLRAKI